MRRDPGKLCGSTFDLLVIGAGIHGAFIGWDAALRGLRVAVVDRGDFGAATSANSLRIVHGGLRYLARGDFPRMRESVRERSALLRIAPHLVRPLPVLVPTRGRGLHGRPAMRIALALNDAITARRNRGLGPGQSIPRGRVVTRAEARHLFPGLTAPALTGGALWYDAQLVHPERLTLAILLAATTQGAVIANYVRADRLLVEGGRVRGAAVTDLVGGVGAEIRARAVVCAAGPWTGELSGPPRPQAFALNLLVARRLADVAAGVRARSDRSVDPVVGGGRFLFTVPQGDATLMGTWYSPATGEPESTLARRGTQTLLEEFNAACPAIELTTADVVRAHWGWLPLKGGLEPGRADALAERPRLIDHGASGGLGGLITVEGVKYTTARWLAERAVDLVFRVLGRPRARSRTASTPVGEAEAPRRALEAEVRHAVREEMAVRLADVVFRRTALGTFPGPTRADAEAAGRVAAEELGWDQAMLDVEVEDVMRQAGAGTRESVAGVAG